MFSMLLVKGGFLRGIIMNNDEFKQHFIKILSDLGVTDYNTKLFVVEPCVESGKGYNAKDDIMRLGVFPRTRELGYEEFIKTEYYPIDQQLLDYYSLRQFVIELLK